MNVPTEQSSQQINTLISCQGFRLAKGPALEMKHRKRSCIAACRLAQAGYYLRYAYVTQRGFYPDARQKPNQDAVYAQHNFADGLESLLFAVYDGHGTHGTMCAQFSREKVRLRFAT